MKETFHKVKTTGETPMIPEYSSHELYFNEKYLTALLEYDVE